jgi:N-acetylmuramic acid 6-phosphate etherase
MGISASGNAEYVASAMRAAREIGCVTISLSSNEDCKIGRIADIPIFVDTGAEVISGSTRMKAGNSQKFVLNMITTCAMAKTGKVYENLMINLRPTNIKLKGRMIGIVAEICGVDDDEALRLLEENDFSIRKVFEKFGKV